MKVALVVGTRPEVIKMAPVIKELQKRKIEFVLVHSNQHYSDNMDAVFFEELQLPAPHYNLKVGSDTHANQIARILMQLSTILAEENPEYLLVQGDTNTVAAAALAGAQLQIKVGHIEAGLRSYDRTMPEESNRVITDHVSDLLFAVSETQEKILEGEGISSNKVFRVGNTIVDMLNFAKEVCDTHSNILTSMKLNPKSYSLFTAHRASNVDNAQALAELVRVVEHLSTTSQIVWPIHPRTKKKLNEFGLRLPDSVVTTEPLGYWDFLSLLKNAERVFTDSGGIQEEACGLNVPCLTLRENTERPESVEVGANFLVGRSIERIDEALANFAKRDATWSNPYGDGQSARRIVDIVTTGQTHEFYHGSDATELPQHVCVVGLGYMGLPSALLLAQGGHRVTGFDIDEKKVEALNTGEFPFDEKGLPELFAQVHGSGRFEAQTALTAADVYLVAVPTPHQNGRCDLSYLEKACAAVAEVAPQGSLVIVESTIRPGTCKDVIGPLFEKLGKQVHLAHCPERAIPGNTLYELIHNDRIIGCNDHQASSRIENLYRSFVRGQCFKTTVAVAEIVKLSENTYRDINIAYANELMEICRDQEVDVFEVIRLANRHPRVNIHSPGTGVGGHCISVDPWFLTEGNDKAQLITTARGINDQKPQLVVEEFQRWLKAQSIAGKSICVLGAAYKPNVDDTRESPSTEVARELENRGFVVKGHDPHVTQWDYELIGLEEANEWSDAFLLATPHGLFEDYQLKRPTFSGIQLDTLN